MRCVARDMRRKRYAVARAAAFAYAVVIAAAPRRYEPPLPRHRLRQLLLPMSSLLDVCDVARAEARPCGMPARYAQREGSGATPGEKAILRGCKEIALRERWRRRVARARNTCDN